MHRPQLNSKSPDLVTPIAQPTTLGEQAKHPNHLFLIVVSGCGEVTRIPDSCSAQCESRAINKLGSLRQEPHSNVRFSLPPFYIYITHPPPLVSSVTYIRVFCNND